MTTQFRSMAEDYNDLYNEDVEKLAAERNCTVLTPKEQMK